MEYRRRGRNGIFTKRPSIHWMMTGYFWPSALQIYGSLILLWNQFHVSKMRRPIFTLRSCGVEVSPSGQLCAKVNPVTGELHGKCLCLIRFTEIDSHFPWTENRMEDRHRNGGRTQTLHSTPRREWIRISYDCIVFTILPTVIWKPW